MSDTVTEFYFCNCKHRAIARPVDLLGKIKSDDEILLVFSSLLGNEMVSKQICCGRLSELYRDVECDNCETKIGRLLERVVKEGPPLWISGNFLMPMGKSVRTTSRFSLALDANYNGSNCFDASICDVFGMKGPEKLKVLIAVAARHHELNVVKAATKLDWELTVVSSASQLVQACDDIHFNFILVAIQMEGALQAVHTMNNMGLHLKNTVLVGLTEGLVASNFVTLFKDAGITKILELPVKTNHLEELVGDALDIDDSMKSALKRRITEL